ncbi:MAG: HAD family phosphatase [Actinobacteria bacterium]|nr:HAD family phosphatase [Actinomycetota bacterium]
MIRFVVFDLGQVLSSPPDLYRTPARLMGVDPDAYEALYWEHRRDYDAGGSRVEYWQPILESLEVPPTGALISQLATLDADLWLEPRAEALDLVNGVYAWGVRTALLSNAPLVMGKLIRHTEWAGLFDRMFISAELGLVKPDPEVFRVVTDELEVRPDEIAFIDDREPNVVAARELGWRAHLWVDDADSRAWLESVCTTEGLESVG